jgi:hypothetical protein
MDNRTSNSYEIKFGTTTFEVTAKYSGEKTLEEVLKMSIKRRIQSEAFEKRSFAFPTAES